MKHLLVVLLVVLLFAKGYSQDTLYEKALDTYVWPIVPGTPEWKNLHTSSEMHKVCQIPENILTTMSTEGLIQTCLTYPILSTSLSASWSPFYEYRKSMDWLLNNFNGLQDLTKRPDAPIKLIETFKKLNSNNVLTTNIPYTHNQKFLYNKTVLLFIELLVSEDFVFNSLNEVQKKELFKLCSESYFHNRYFRSKGISEVTPENAEKIEKILEEIYK
ncbi:MAG: hypothetical protein HY738_23050 [Bacteroidia bacterium]|nr:hypothetical protein [Bacteroidia bacterium]